MDFDLLAEAHILSICSKGNLGLDVLYLSQTFAISHFLVGGNRAAKYCRSWKYLVCNWKMRANKNYKYRQNDKFHQREKPGIKKRKIKAPLDDLEI